MAEAEGAGDGEEGNTDKGRKLLIPFEYLYFR